MIIMDRFWVIVADSALVKVFKTQRIGGPMEFVKKLGNEAAHHKDIDMVSDRQGGHRWPGNAGTFESRSDPKQVEILEFAEFIVKNLEKDHNNHVFEKLVLVAPAKFMGDLREKMPHHLHQVVEFELVKDYTRLTTQELEKELDIHRK